MSKVQRARRSTRGRPSTASASRCAFYVRSLALEPAHHPPLQEGGHTAARRGRPSAPARSSVIGGTVGVIAFLAFFTGSQVGLQGYSSLNQLGTGAFTGFVSAYLNTREIAPLVAGLALAATVGCGFTAQLGAMRISEEVDALEVMGIPSLPFLVTTPHDRRLRRRRPALRPRAALVVCRDPLHRRPRYFGQSAGTYDHYFHLFLPPVDVLSPSSR